MGSLPIGIQQLVELSRILFSGARVIILDEPTSALSPPEIERLFDLLRILRNGGRTIVFISHFLDDVLEFPTRLRSSAMDARWSRPPRRTSTRAGSSSA